MHNVTSVFAGVEKSFAMLDRLAWVSLMFTLSAAISNITNQAEVSLLGIEFPFMGAYLGVGILTLVHVFFMRYVIISCADAWQSLTLDSRNELFDHIVRTGGVLTKGANAYREALTEDEYTLNIRTSLNDNPTWIHHIIILLTFLALVDFEFSLLTLSQFCFALALALINWRIGESWLLCLGDLGSEKEKSVFFEDGTARPRSISRISGLSIGRNIGFRNFFFSAILESILNAFILWLLLLLPFFAIWAMVASIR